MIFRTTGYKFGGANIAISVLDWICFTLMVFATFYVSRAARHVLNNGPEIGVEEKMPERLGKKYLVRFLPASVRNKFNTRPSVGVASTPQMSEGNTVNERV